jgi:hypothetical protein
VFRDVGFCAVGVSERASKVTSLQHVRVGCLRKVTSVARVACLPSKAVGDEWCICCRVVDAHLLQSSCNVMKACTGCSGSALGHEQQCLCTSKGMPPSVCWLVPALVHVDMQNIMLNDGEIETGMQVDEQHCLRLGVCSDRLLVLGSSTRGLRDHSTAHGRNSH